jgi:hypothetical protein
MSQFYVTDKETAVRARDSVRHRNTDYDEWHGWRKDRNLHWPGAVC